MSRGKTWPRVRPNHRATYWNDRPNVNVCVDIDSARTIALELSRVAPV